MLRGRGERTEHARQRANVARKDSRLGRKFPQAPASSKPEGWMEEGWEVKLRAAEELAPDGLDCNTTLR